MIVFSSFAFYRSFQISGQVSYLYAGWVNSVSMLSFFHSELITFEIKHTLRN